MSDGYAHPGHNQQVVLVVEINSAIVARVDYDILRGLRQNCHGHKLTEIKLPLKQLMNSPANSQRTISGRFSALCQ